MNSDKRSLILGPPPPGEGGDKVRSMLQKGLCWHTSTGSASPSAIRAPLKCQASLQFDSAQLHEVGPLLMIARRLGEDMHYHSANQGPFGTIHGGTPRVDGNATLVVQLNRGSINRDR